MLYKMIENPQEGTPVQYLGVYVLRWRQEWGEPTYAFVESDEYRDLKSKLDIALEALREIYKRYEHGRGSGAGMVANRALKKLEE